MAQKFFEDKIPHNGLTYKEYSDIWEKELQESEAAGNTTVNNIKYKRLNRHRSQRIEKNFQLPEELKNELHNIDEPQLWMVITESWCGDSAQSLPIIVKMAEENDKINLRIVLRDSHPEIMERYLTNGTKSIPKLVSFDEEGNELFVWGPRPKEAHDLFMQMKKDGITAPELYEKLHLWYGKNRGKNLTDEFINLLKEHSVTV